MGYTYLMSDIHGCFDEYIMLLDRISFSENDELYILGDAMDRGREPIKVIRDIMKRDNVHYICGNHDEMFLNVISRLGKEITEETLENFSRDDMLSYYDYVFNGGEVTLNQYRKLLKEEQNDIIDFISSVPFYETVVCDKKLYILTHAGISNFQKEKELYDYLPDDFLWGRADYNKNYYESERIFIVSGHTPTILIREDEKPLIYKENNHIAIDCGCVFGGQLAAYCIETGEEFYIPKISR